MVLASCILRPSFGLEVTATVTAVVTTIIATPVATVATVDGLAEEHATQQTTAHTERSSTTCTEATSPPRRGLLLNVLRLAVAVPSARWSVAAAAVSSRAHGWSSVASAVTSAVASSWRAVARPLRRVTLLITGGLGRVGTSGRCLLGVR